MDRRARQLWIDGVAKWCDHKAVEHVRSTEGKVIAEVCMSCQARLAEYGTCNGCTQPKRLTKFQLNRRPPRRFCTDDCYRHTLNAEAEAKAAVRAAEAAALAGRKS